MKNLKSIYMCTFAYKMSHKSMCVYVCIQDELPIHICVCMYVYRVSNMSIYMCMYVYRVSHKSVFTCAKWCGPVLADGRSHTQNTSSDICNL